ncbi:MAG TPA: phosphoribosyltransferase family protein [Candidatus Dormibacteraeota bacterium]|nr:phosphoribosyltransferase family protein [Candidatus Dormibacteraeota bacterium]
MTHPLGPEPPHRRFRDRLEAGDALGREVREYAGWPGVLVLGLARGGVPVAARVAAALGAPLDVLVIRKLGVPWQPELAMGAIGHGGVRVLDRELIEAAGIPCSIVHEVLERELAELTRRERAYRAWPPADPAGRTVILVDDGMATGASMEAAIKVVRARRPAAVAVAVPVASLTACRRIARLADRLVCISPARRFVGVGQWYDDFSPTSDGEVRRLLRLAQAGPGARQRCGGVA